MDQEPPEKKKDIILYKLRNILDEKIIFYLIFIQAVNDSQTKNGAKYDRITDVNAVEYREQQINKILKNKN